MKFARVEYKGADDRIGRFKEVKTGDEILLTPSEYDCVKDDPRYEFKEWDTVEGEKEKKVQKPTRASRSNSVTSPDPKSPVTVDDEISEASRVGQDQVEESEVKEEVKDVEVAVEEQTEEVFSEGEDDYEDYTVSQLKDEVKIRNELIEEEDGEFIVPESQRKSDLIAALRRYDDEEVSG